MDWDAAVLAAMMACLGWLIRNSINGLKTDLTRRIDRLEETNAKAVEGLRAEIGSRTGEVKTDLAKRIDELDAVNRAEHATLAMDVKGLRSQVDKLDGYAGLDFASRLKTYLRNVPPEGDE